MFNKIEVLLLLNGGRDRGLRQLTYVFKLLQQQLRMLDWQSYCELTVCVTWIWCCWSRRRSRSCRSGSRTRWLCLEPVSGSHWYSPKTGIYHGTFPEVPSPPLQTKTHIFTDYLMVITVSLIDQSIYRVFVKSHTAPYILNKLKRASTNV